MVEYGFVDTGKNNGAAGKRDVLFQLYPPLISITFMKRSLLQPVGKEFPVLHWQRTQ
jgi:hypothetical protein